MQLFARRHLTRNQRIHRLVTSLKHIGLGVSLVLVSSLSLTAIYSYTRGGAQHAYAAAPNTLNFQARLLNGNGSIVADGNYSVQFKLYDAASAGTNEWTETQTVAVKAGYLSVHLGSVTVFPSTVDWTQQHWLTMNVGGDGEMTPRIKLTAVPFAFAAAQAAGLTSGATTIGADGFAQLTPAGLQAMSSGVAGLRLNQTGAGGLIQFQGNGSDVLTVSKTGDIAANGTLNLTAAGLQTNSVSRLTNGGALENITGLTIISGGANITGNVDISGTFTSGNGNAFNVNADGDVTSAFTALNGTSTTTAAAVIASTSLTLNDATNFDVGNYVQVNATNCGGTGINVCYAKVTAKTVNTLTITPSLTWSNGATVNEYHVPEIGGTDTAQSLANRYGRGYFIAGVATGNGTTYYNEDSITSSLSDFDLLTSLSGALNIGSSAASISIGNGSTTLALPGTLSVQGSTINIGSTTQQGALVLQNGAAKTGTIIAGTLAANRTYTLPDLDGTICLTTTCTGGGGPTDAFVKDGNTFGVLATLGTNDAFGLAFETSGLQRLLIDAGGNVGIGTSGAPSQLLSVGGTTGNFTVDSSGAVVAAGLTSNAGLSVTSGGASVTGGLNNNSGGITNAGNITGVGSNITGADALTIASGGTADLTLNSASGIAVLGATTVQTADNLLLNMINATDTALSLQNGGAGVANLNLVDGGLQTGGTVRLTNAGVLQNITGLTVSSGDAFFNGNVTIGDTAGDRLTVISHILGANALTFQGATDNIFATTLAITDPTANNTVILPDASGTLVLDSRTITTAAGSGLTGGGDLSANRSLSLDIFGITSKTNVNPNDYIAIYDDTTTSLKKISRNDFLQGVIGAMQYRGGWNAAGNVPLLQDGTGTTGDTYVVTIAGSQNFGQGPSISFEIGDFVIYNGTDWEKISSASQVASVFGRTGAITAQNGDYTGLQITNTPSGSLSATNVQAALNELANEKLGSLNGLTAITQTFANDTNFTITSAGSTHTLGWAGLLAVGRGGTGASTFTTNGVIFGNGTGALQVSAAGTGGQLLLADASGVPTFTSLSGDATISNTGVLTIGANTINLGTDTVGNYIASLGTLTGLTAGGTTGEGAIPTLSVTYGSLANTAVQGNTSLTVTAGTNLSGGGAITLGAGGTVTINTIANPTFGTSVTTPILTSAAGLSITSGGTGDITLDSASNKIIIGGTDTTLERTGAGGFTIDLKDNAATTLTLSNTNAGGSSFAHLNLADGELLTAGVSRLSNGGGLQNITGYAQSSGNFAISGAGTFSTGTGTVGLNGAVTAASTLTVTGLTTLNGNLTMQTGDTFTFNGDAFTDLAGSGLIVSAGVLTVDATTSGTTAVTTSNSGIESTAAGIRLLGGCANTQILKWGTAGGGAWACAADNTGISDARLKKNIEAINMDTLSRIRDVQLYSFDYDCTNPAFETTYCDTTHQQAGVIAQELMQLFPELVTDVNGHYEVNYNALGLYNLKAVGELANQVDTLAAFTQPNEIITDGVLRMTSNGGLQNINGLNLTSGGASIIGGLNNNNGGISNVGALSGVTSLSAQNINLTAGTGDFLNLIKDGNGVFTIFNTGALQMRLDSGNALAIKSANGASVFNVDTLSGRVVIGSGDDAKTVLFVLDSKSTEGDPAGTNGAQYYNAKSNKFRCYQNNKWEDCLPSTYSEYTIVGQLQTWAQPAADTEFPGEQRTWIDLTKANQFRMIARINTAGLANATCRIQYAFSDDGEWKDISSDNAAKMNIDHTGTLKTEWLGITDDAKKEALVRVSCQGGDALSTPVISSVKLQAR